MCAPIVLRSQPSFLLFMAQIVTWQKLLQHMCCALSLSLKLILSLEVEQKIVKSNEGAIV